MLWSVSSPGRAVRRAVLLCVVAVMLAPAAAVSQDVPIPELARWRDQMITYGLKHCTVGALDDVYYDGERIFYQIAAYTGDATWTTCAQFAESTYRDNYVLPNNGSVPGYWNFTTGLRIDFERTGDPPSREAAVLLSQNMFARDGVPLDWTASADASREVAYAILSYINAEALGEPKRQRRIDLVNQAYDHLDQWFVRFAWPGPWQKSPQEAERLAPFMVALTSHALIRDWEQTGDSRLIPALRRAADWMWTNAWMAGYESMWYESLDRSSGAPDLNMLIAPMYGFLYRQTGETKYRDEGDALFAGGARRAYLSGGKQFNQNYWWSFDYVQWRNAAPGGTPPPADVVAPVVAVTEPAAGTDINGIVAVSATASDNVGVTGVQFKVNGTNLGGEDTSAPYSVRWDTTNLTNGSYTLTAVARDAAGNTSTSPTVKINVANAIADVTRPTVTITSPGSGTIVSDTVTVSASASDDVGVGGVQFKVDNATVGSEQNAAPYRVTVDTRTLANGSHTVSAVARDTSNNTATATITVTVSNDTTPPALSAVSASNISTSSATITWTTNEPSDSQVEYGTTSAYGSTTSDGTLVTAHSRTLSGLAAGTVYHYRVKSKDNRGNPATSGDQTFTTSPAASPAPSPTPLPTTNLIGYWAFNEGTGSTAADGSGNGRTGNLVQSPVWTAGKLGSALSFNGVRGFVDVRNSAAFNTYPLTVAAWIKTSSTSGVRGIVTKYIAESFDGWSLFMNDGRLCAWFYKNKNRAVYQGGGCTFGVSGYNDNRWHHVAYVVDSNGGRLYVDGVLKGSMGWTGEPGAPSTTQEVHVGHYPYAYGGAEYFDGLIDDVRIYGQALSADHIRSLAAQ